ncbi:MAG: BamA/TamA family outer membrane protein [Myxococcales bacterium]|nr:BamA/TamA family outer membrane protein [Myxococcales bacterium]
MDDSDRVLADLLRGTDDHALLTVLAGILLDLRDNEFHPSSGTLTEVSARLSPGVDDELRYAQLTASSAWFFSLIGDRLVAAVRFAQDFILGDAPFYQLSSFGGLLPFDGPGGESSVRGVLLQRFYGRIKTLGNLELRSELLPFRVGSQHFVVGAIAFADAGRVWADTRERTVDGRRLDGSFDDFATGVGGGLRLRWGDTFIIRSDLGYSPSEETIGFYLTINHVF